MARGYKIKKGTVGRVNDNPIIDGVGLVLRSDLKIHRRICIESFGCFEIKAGKSWKNWNPTVNKFTKVRPRLRIKFTPSTVLKKYINEPEKH